jgi:hypothetical protein
MAAKKPRSRVVLDTWTELSLVKKFLVGFAALAAASVTIITTGYKAVAYVDDRYVLVMDYKSAAQQQSVDILELRRDGLDSVRRDLMRASRQRPLSVQEQESLEKLNETIRKIDGRLEQLTRGGR